MGRWLFIGALLLGGYFYLADNGGVRLSGGKSGGGGFSTYSGSSGSAIKGIAGAAGG